MTTRNEEDKAESTQNSGFRLEDADSGGMRHYLEVLGRRAWLAAAVFAGVFAAVFTACISERTEYRASASLFVGQDEWSAGRVNLFGREQGAWASRGPNLANHIELLRSRVMAERVVGALPESARVWLAGLGLERPDRVQALVALRPVRDADIIRIWVRAPSAGLARLLTEGYVTAYRDFSQTRSRADVSATRSFVEMQLTAVAARLDSAEAGLEAYKRSQSITDVREETRALVERQTRSLVRYEEASAERAGLEQRVGFLKAALNETGLEHKPSVAVIAEMKEERQRLEVERAGLAAAGYETTSARVRALALRQRAVEHGLETEAARLPVSGTSGAAEVRAVLDQLHALEPQLVQARETETVLAAQSAGYDRELDRLPAQERALARLARDVEVNRQVHALLAQRREEARIQEAGRISSIGVVDPAGDAVRTKPNVRNSVLMALVLSLSLSVGTMLVVDRFDNKVREPEDLERQGFVVLASVPRLVTSTQPAQEAELVTLGQPTLDSGLPTPGSAGETAVEAFRLLRTNVQFAAAGNETRTMLVTSAEPGEGKTLVAANLAVVLAQSGKRTLLVDADLRKPRQHTLFGRRKKPGLTDATLLGSSLEQTVRPGPVECLSLLFAGTLPPSPVDFLNSEAFARLLAVLRAKYDCVLIDSPPALVSADAAILASVADGVLLVARMGRADRRGLAESYKALSRAGARVIGLVANDLKPRAAYGSYRYRYRYYHSRYRQALGAT